MLGVVRRLREHRFVDVRVERPLRLDLGQALLLERLPQRLLDQLHAVDQRSLLVALGRLERPLQVVEHGQELPDEPLVGVRDQALLVARRPLAVVLEVGLRSLEEIEVLVPLRLGLARGSSGVGPVGSDPPLRHAACLDPGSDPCGSDLGACVGASFGSPRHEVFASSSSSMTS